jgi:hypothetical protein
MMCRLKDALFEWQRRAGELEGDDLELLSAPALRRLVTLQQVGLERSQNALANLINQKISP